MPLILRYGVNDGIRIMEPLNPERGTLELVVRGITPGNPLAADFELLEGIFSEEFTLFGGERRRIFSKCTMRLSPKMKRGPRVVLYLYAPSTINFGARRKYLSQDL